MTDGQILATLNTDDLQLQVELAEQTLIAQQSNYNGLIEPPTKLELAQADATGGVIVATHEGSVELKGTVNLVVEAGQVGLMLSNGQTFMLPVVPDALIRDPAPDPEGCE